MRFFINACKKCGDQENGKRRGTLAASDTDVIADCLSCGQSHIIVKMKEGINVVLLERNQVA